MTSVPPAAPRPGRLGRFLQSRGTLESRSVAAAATIVAVGFIGSRVLGLVRSAAIARAFGTEPDLAAYWVAFRLPDLVFQVLAGATLAAAFIPTFSRVQLRFGEDEAWRLASSVLNLIAIATVVAAGLAWLFAPVLVPLLAPGLGEDSGRAEELQAVAVDLTRLMLLSPVLFGISGMLTGILNARRHFVAPALAPMVYNLAIILGALFLAEPLGVRGLAVAVVAGSAAHLLVQVPALRLVGMRWTPSLEPSSPAVREVGRLMGPRVIGLAAAQVNFVVVTFFASFISDQAISAVNYGFLMAMLPVGVIGMAISTALFPTLAEQAATRQVQQLRNTLSTSLRMILYLAVPASVGLGLLAEPATVLLLQRGAFDEESTAAVTSAVQVYAFGVGAVAAVEILSRGYYALSDTRTPVQLAVLAMVLNVALAAALVGPFGVRGLAAAASISGTIEALALWALLDRRLGGLGRRHLRRSLLRTLGAAVVMAEVIVLLLILLRAAGVSSSEPWGALVVALASGLGGLLAYAFSSSLLRSEEYRALVSRL